MSKSSSFKAWYKDHQEHPSQIKAALEAIIELEDAMVIYCREELGYKDFDGDKVCVEYFLNHAKEFGG